MSTQSIPQKNIFHRIIYRLTYLFLRPPSLRLQRIIAFAVICTQGGIAITGAIVRVTSSGLGCPTWPQCFPGSFTPVAGTQVGHIHQIVEFGNRLLSFFVVMTAAAVVVAVIRAKRRREVLIYAWVMPLSTVVQAIIGGITVRTGLLWWTIALHLLVSMAMIWISVLLFVKIGHVKTTETDFVHNTDVSPGLNSHVPGFLRGLTALMAITLAGVLVAGTLVTAAGPHAGDKSPQRVVPRLSIDISTLVHIHADLLVAYLGLLIGLGCGLYAVSASRAVKLRFIALLMVVTLQAGIGITQYFTGVPAILVALHVGGAVMCTAVTAALWAAMASSSHTPEWLLPPAHSAMMTLSGSSHIA